MSVATIAAVIVCLRRRQHRLALVWVLVMSGGYVLTELLKALVGRARPLQAEAFLTADDSFPSGHTSMTLVLVGFALHLFLQRERPSSTRWAAIVGAAAWCGLMGASRLLLGDHYWSDVLGGYLLGIAWLAGGIYCGSQVLGTR